MKKFLFLLILVLLPFNVFAVSYTVNDVEYEVNSIERFRDYCYFNYFKDSNYTEFLVFPFTSGGVSYPQCIVGGSQFNWAWDSLYGTSGYFDLIDCTSNYSSCSYSPNQSSLSNFNGGVQSLSYSNYNVYNFNDEIVFSQNVNFQDIENSYNSSGGGEEPEEPSSPDFDYTPIWVLCTILFIFFWVWYLRICFPMKGGKNL